MGRHTDPNDTAFRRDLLRAVAGATVALVVVAAVTGAFFLFGRDDTPQLAAGAGTETDRGAPPSSEATRGTGADSDTGAGEPSESAAEEQEPASEPSVIEQAPRPQDTTVQVLDGVGTGGQAEDAAAVLRDLGYDVVVVNPAGLDYASTRVLTTAGHEIDGEALIARDGRFGGLDRNRTLSTEIDLHVVVGADWES